MNLVQLKRGTFEYKLGLNCLIQLADFSKINVEDDFRLILYCGLKTYNSDLNYNDVLETEFSEKEKQELIERLNMRAIPNMIPSPDDIHEWYSRGLGELGLSLDTFFSLSPQELDAAYLGYLRRVELTCNTMRLAIMRAQRGDTSEISLTPQVAVRYGTLAERQKTLDMIGV